MDSIHFDAYNSYSDSSTPRTPSPNDSLPNSPPYKLNDMPFWSTQPTQFHSRGSLLGELYDDHSITPELPVQHQQVYVDAPFSNDWSRPQDYAALRRATFPYVRHDREDGLQQQQQQQQQQFSPTFISADQQPILTNPYASRPDALYGEPISMQDRRQQSLNIKLEDPSPVIVPSQSAFYRPPSQSSCHPMTASYLSPFSGLTVQHTDDAASKETQYLRRRCFNCHTTEPPSWRRSTLNPGKIVCNKCGLYERTHLRPRPLRFDELRAGNKARKQSKGGVASPKTKTSGLVKKETREYGLVRRSSTSSTSSVHSTGTSDWEDSVYSTSTSSAPPSSYNSPSVPTYTIPRVSQSPPLDGGIRLPNNPLSDIASLKSATEPIPASYYPTPPSSASSPQLYHTHRADTAPAAIPTESGWPCEDAGANGNGNGTAVTN